MSGYNNGHHDYDDGYGHQHGNNTDSYYQDENQQYYDQNGYDAHGGQHGGGEGYYDESYVPTLPHSNLGPMFLHQGLTIE